MTHRPGLPPRHLRIFPAVRGGLHNQSGFPGCLRRLHQYVLPGTHHHIYRGIQADRKQVWLVCKHSIIYPLYLPWRLSHPSGDTARPRKEENSKINELLHCFVQEFSITLRKYHSFAASNPPAAYRLWFGVSSSADHTRARSDPG